MKTIVKRIRTNRSADEIAAKVISLRQAGNVLSAWAETEGRRNVLCVRMEVVSAPPSILRVAHLLN